MKPPLISVIIPFYNMEVFLAEAIESVLNQTYSDWELLLVNDGSTDKSTQIAAQYVQRFPASIFYFTHQDNRNRGLTLTRNEGLKNARGTYIALLDADDCWLEDKLEKQVAILEAYPDCALLGGASLYWYSWEHPEKEDIPIRVGGMNDQLVAPPRFAYDLYPLGEGAAPCPSSLIFKKDTAIRHGGFEPAFDGIFQMYEDQAFLAKMYLHEYVYMSSGCLDRYRQRTGSLVENVYQQGAYQAVRNFFLDWLLRYMDTRGIGENELRKRIRLARKPGQKGWFRKAKDLARKIINR